jgi:predicted transcriptional regulator
VGVMKGMPDSYRELNKQVKFKVAKENFIRAARTGIESYFNWFGKETSAVELVQNVLLPMAREGLEKAGVNAGDIDRYLGIIEGRIENRQTGSKWIKRNKSILSDSFSNYEINVLLTRQMYEYQQENRPVHTWENMDECRDKLLRTRNKAYKIMSRELFVVHEDDSLVLVQKIMKWKNIHHIPVINDDNKMVGMVNASMFDVLPKKIDLESDLCVKDIMNDEFIKIHPETSIENMEQLIQNKEISSLAVIYKDELMGIVTKTDLKEARVLV